MGNITEKQKQDFYEFYQQGYGSDSIAKKVGVSKAHSNRIAKSFDAGDFSWLYNSRRQFSEFYDEQEKKEIVLEAISGKYSFRELVAKFHLPENVIRRWIRNYKKDGVCGKQNDTRRKRTEKITRRDHYLQNILPSMCRGGKIPSKKKILRTIGECRRFGITVKDCLSKLGVSSSTYYFWKRQEQEEKGSQKDEELSKAIRELQEGNHWSYGSKRMAKELVKSGICDKINHKRVARIMDKFVLHAKVRVRHFPKHYYLAQKENAENMPKNVLDRDFTSDSPMQKLVTDITYIRTKEGWLYLAVVLDLYNREVVTYKTAQKINVELVKAVVEQIAVKHNLNGVLIHSDMGWTYSNRDYMEFLRSLGVCQSMSRKGNVLDNAMIENFFGMFKTETIYQNGKKILSVKDMNKLIDEYVYWFNNERIQKKLGYLSPVDYRTMIA